jgi:hypothetical protein
MVHGRLEEAEQCLSEALDLRRRLGDDRRLVEPLIDHAWVMFVHGRGEEAMRSFLDCLALARHVSDQFNVGEALAGLSAQAALDGHPADAARLAGASAALHEQMGAPPWESVTAMQERALAAAHEALGSRYAATFAEGCRMAPEDAVARLLSGSPQVAAPSAR